MPVTPRKRKGSVDADINPNAVGSNISLPPPTTPPRGEIDKYFSQVLCPLIGHLPYQSKLSPDKRIKTPHHHVVEMVKFFYFQNRQKLDQLVDELKPPLDDGLEQPRIDPSDEVGRFNKFYQQLQIPYQTAVSNRMSPDHNQRNTNVYATDMPPPTRGVLFPSATKSNLAASPNMDNSFTSNTTGLDSATTSFASTARSNGASSYFTKSYNSIATGITSADTSFASDAAAKTLPNTPLQSTQEDVIDVSSDCYGSSFDLSTTEGDGLEQQAAMTMNPESPKAPQANSTPSTGLTEPSRPIFMPEAVNAGANRTPSVEISPSKSISYRIADIPKHGLAPIDLPVELHRVPIHRRIELYRVMRATGMKPAQFVEELSRDPSFSEMYRLLTLFPVSSFTKSETLELSRCTLQASMQWSKERRGPLFDFVLQPPQSQELGAFQRRFGADRFLLVDFPPLNRPPPDYSGERSTILECVQEMLGNTQKFLGRRWEAYHVDEKKTRIAFFAVSGIDIGNQVSISQLLNWFVPFGLNSHQAACKASARFDLGQSKTKETITFEHHQVQRVRDTFATKAPSDTRFDDPSLSHRFKHRFDGRMVMNDGCNEISYAAMVKVQEALKLDHLPAVVQGRVFGAKGLWYRSADEASEELYIRISDSQTKVNHVLGKTTDPAHLHLGVVKWSRPARSSILYSGYLPILQHRGVPASTLLDIARRQVRIDTAEFLSCFHDRRTLRQWVHLQKDLSGARMRDESIWKVGSLPNLGAERICLLAESGFEPLTCKKLAEETVKLGKMVFNLEASQFKVTISQSTSLWGIADPTGVLDPGEIYLTFSETFKESNTGRSLTMLDEKECLVARNPALRDSDIQKVRAVYRAELSHLQDVVVFSSRGNRPLASMLQGGDYDGDTFWVCWDPALVQPFKNAPAPWESDMPDLTTFGITKDKALLRDIVHTKDEAGDYHEEEVRSLVDRSIAERLKMSLLGTVTLTHGQVIYGQDDIATEKATRLVDLHDLLVDGDKQGYRYSEDGWRAFKKRIGVPSNLPKPAHRRFTRTSEEQDTGPTQIASTEPQYHKNDIIDRLYFQVVLPEVDLAMAKARDLTRLVPSKDEALSQQYLDLCKVNPTVNSIIGEELRALGTQLADLKTEWLRVTSGYARGNKQPKVWNTGVERCRQVYLAIEPKARDHPTVAEWLRPKGQGLRGWDEVKASMLAHEYHVNPDMIFSVAGFELCHLKAYSEGCVRPVREDLYFQLKPRKRKVDDVPLDGREFDDSDDGDSVSEFFASDSLIDAMESIDDLSIPNAPPVPPKPLSWNA